MPRRLSTPVTRASAREFLIASTRPGDVIVVGPPFVLSAASDARLPEDRQIAYVVPMPLFLSDFDPEIFLNEIRRNATVYVGSPNYFESIQKHFREKSPPIFYHGKAQSALFQGKPIIVYRNKIE